MKVSIEFDFFVKHCNGSMSMSINEADRSVFHAQVLPPGFVTVKVPLRQWPTRLTFMLGNRSTHDVEQDEDGIILADKAIEVTGIRINNFPLHLDLLDRVFQCHRDDQILPTCENYWAFTGNVVLDLDRATPMRFLLDKLNAFDITRLNWNQND